MQANKIKELGEEIENFLIFGPEEEVEDLNSIESRNHVGFEVKNLIQKYQVFREDQHRLYQRVEESYTKTSMTHDQLRNFHDNKFMPKYKLYLHTQYKLQLFTLMKHVRTLEQCHDVKKIPEIILTIKEYMPRVLHDRSKIKATIATIIDQKKKTILEKFYYFFENHFQQEDNQTHHDTVTSEGESYELLGINEASTSSSWESFLKQSQQWLLTYTLLSLLLPVLTQQSTTAILETFKEALDLALTPLWGRFYYHLSLSIEIKSRKQILWTFYYAKSFIEMLFNLMIHITVNQQPLKQLYSEVNYLIAAEEQIVEKSMKFLKAHIASILVIEILPTITFSSANTLNILSSSVQSTMSWDREFGIQIIEEVLELDQWLSTYLKTSSAAHYTTAILLAEVKPVQTSLAGSYYQGFAEVIYDCKEVFHQWLFEERKLVLEKLQGWTTTDDTTYQVFLPSIQSILEADEIVRLTATNHKAAEITPISSLLSSTTSSLTSPYQCYAGIYHGVALFLLLRERYSYFPLNAQSILTEVILEPLLCYLLSLLLYRIRNHKLLYHISMDLYENKYPENQQLSEYRLFQQTIDYITQCLDHASILFTQSGRVMIGNSERCRKKWTILQNWIPKILITKEQEKAGFTREHLLQIAFKLTGKYQGNTATTNSSSGITTSTSTGPYSYRPIIQHPLMRRLQQYGHLQPISNHNRNSEGEKDMKMTSHDISSDDDLEVSIQLIMELAKTLVMVLEKHFHQ